MIREDRDPGERVISVAYCALINVKDYDDSLRERYGLEWVPVENMPKLYSDHNTMVKDALAMLRRHINTEPLSFNLLPELFTLRGAALYRFNSKAYDEDPEFKL